MQTEALYPPHLLPVPSNVLQLVLAYAFLSKATQKGNRIKAARSQYFQKKAMYKSTSVEKAAKKNKNPFLRISRGIEPIFSKKKKNAGKNSLPRPDQKFEDGMR